MRPHPFRRHLNRGRRRLALPVILSMLVGACTLGPEPRRPDNVAQSAERFVNADPPADQKPDRQEGDLARWWERLADPVTTELVNQALAHNTDLRAAAARVLQARSSFEAATGRRLPVAGAGFRADRTQSVFFGLGVPIGSVNNTYDLNFNVSWQVDLLGKLKRQQQAAWAELLSSQAARQAVVHSVVAEVVRARVEIATLQRQLADQRANTANWHKTVEVVRRRYDKGLAGSVLEVRLAEENLAASQAAEPELEKQLRQAYHRLDILLGRQPGTGSALPATLSPLPALPPVPPGLPAWLLDRRPDLRASELSQAAATLRIGSAMAEMYPDLTLSASGGWRSNKLGRLIEPQTEVFSLASELAWKIWAGGALRANVKLAKAQAEQAAAEYAGLVLKAMGEVEDALVRQRTVEQACRQLGRRLAEVRRAEQVALERYKRGLEPLLTVLETQRRRRQAEMDLVRMQGLLWQARIDLYLALGGDWQVPQVGSVFGAPQGEGGTGQGDKESS